MFNYEGRHYNLRMISVFTPTYNRAYILPQLYESLKRQTCKNFEWIIVDDGSKDDTELLVNQWINEENDFIIIYEKQENGGKHTAINRGVKLAHYDWFLIVDSDDYVTDDAVEKVHEWINTGINDNYAAVSGTKCFRDSTTIGGEVKFKSRYVDCKDSDRFKYGLGGDKAEVYRTSILKKYPFPVFTGENFISECAVWDKISLDGYLIRWFNEPLMVCEYLEDGLSASSKRGELTLNNFEGYSYATKIRLKTYRGKEYCRTLCAYIYHAHRKKLRVIDISRKLDVDLLSTIIFSIVVYALSPMVSIYLRIRKIRATPQRK